MTRIQNYNPWDSRASHAVTARIAKATPQRQIDVARPGPVTVYVINAPMDSAPPAPRPQAPAPLPNNTAAKWRARPEPGEAS